MFGQTATINLQTQITAIADTITLLEKQLQEAREAKKQLENELQKQLTLIGCGQSALEQAAKFLQMVRHTSDTELETEFWLTIEGMKLQAIAHLPQPDPNPQPETNPQPDPNPQPSPSPTPINQDVEVVEVTEVIEPNPTPDTQPSELSKIGLESFKVAKLRQMLKSIGISDKGIKSELISRLLEHKEKFRDKAA